MGAQRDFGFTPKDHVTLGEALNLLDFEAAAEVSGSKFYYLKNAAALLELALVNYAMTKVRGLACVCVCNCAYVEPLPPRSVPRCVPPPSRFPVPAQLFTTSLRVALKF